MHVINACESKKVFICETVDIGAPLSHRRSVFFSLNFYKPVVFGRKNRLSGSSREEVKANHIYKCQAKSRSTSTVNNGQFVCCESSKITCSHFTPLSG